MSGYRDDQEAQRMRVASLEERLAELEAENEALRVREEAPLTDLPRRGPGEAAGPISADVADTLASLKAMVSDIALTDAERARELASFKATAGDIALTDAERARGRKNSDIDGRVPRRMTPPLDPGFVKLFGLKGAIAPRDTPPAPLDETPLVSLDRLKGERLPESSGFDERRELKRHSYWSGFWNGVGVGVAISVVGLIWLLALSR